MKKFIKNLCILSILFSVYSTTIGAQELPSQAPTSVVTIEDENGKNIDYTIAEGETITVPIYLTEEGNKSRSFTKVASASFFRGPSYVSFLFVPTPAYKYKSFGFVGTFGWTDNSGMQMGEKRFSSEMTGSIHANKPGHAILVGKYSVLDFAPLEVFKTFNWAK